MKTRVLKPVLLAVTAALALSACATATPYGPAGQGSGTTFGGEHGPAASGDGCTCDRKPGSHGSTRAELFTRLSTPMTSNPASWSASQV